MSEINNRTKGLIGEEALLRLKNSTVAVFGIGGVGSYALEALVRSGIGEIYIYDNDTVSESNCNRQLIALSSTVGKPKTQVAAQRSKDINPEVKIVENQVFVTPNTVIPFEKFDYIIDAVDNVTAKLFLAEKATEKGIPIISVMGTGNKLYPEKLKITDINKTEYCPLARVMRRELKAKNIKNLMVVWSDEKPIKAESNADMRETGRPTPSSMTFVPSCAGVFAASFVTRELIK